ncbi:MAG: OmpA family protein [Bacteriovorax sp.]|nr:OmpA family protein [Bacteriovorax sp.]
MKSKTILQMCLLTIALVSCSEMTSKQSSEIKEAVTSKETDEASITLNGDSDLNQAGLLKSIYFHYKSVELSSEAKEILENNAQFLKTNPTIKIKIEGHCDDRGGIKYNRRLGYKRAKTVRDYLVNLGIKNSLSKSISLGKEKPVYFGETEEAWSKNRRVNFVITAK